jgi:hypothetical protein
MEGFDIHIDMPGALRRWDGTQEGIADAVRDTLNATAMAGGDEDRDELQRVFTLRNKWVYNSIWPKHGKRFGLIPPYKRDIMRMFTTAGTVNRDLEKQEDGWTKRDPDIPTKEARVARNPKRIVAKRFRVKSLKPSLALQPEKFMKNKIADRTDRVDAFLAFMNAVNWKGLMYLEHDDVLPAGYYNRKGGSLRLVRRHQKGVKHRKAYRWHATAMARLTTTFNSQRTYNISAQRRINTLSV